MLPRLSSEAIFYSHRRHAIAHPIFSCFCLYLAFFAKIHFITIHHGEFFWNFDMKRVFTLCLIIHFWARAQICIQRIIKHFMKLTMVLHHSYVEWAVRSHCSLSSNSSKTPGRIHWINWYVRRIKCRRSWGYCRRG